MKQSPVRSITCSFFFPSTSIAAGAKAGRYKIDFSNYDYPFISSPDKLRKVYKDVFMNLAKHYTETLGFQVDMSGVNAERLCLIAHDPNVYYNAESTAYIYDITNKTITHTV